MTEALAIQEKPQAPNLGSIADALALLGKERCTVREMRAKILGLEEVMRAIPGHMEPADFEKDTRHHFPAGLYIRELFIPKGTVLTGKIHMTGHMNILSQGDVTVWTEGGMRRLKAYTMIPSEPGMKRVGYAHDDTTWITVHQNPDDCRDVKTVEARLFADTFEEAYLKSDRSFESAIRFLGFSPEEVTRISENTSDLIAFQKIPDSIGIGISPIHGKGVFAVRRIQSGETIALARVGTKRTLVGRYCNHSGKPNARMEMREDGSVDLIAIHAIEPGQEILNDYYLDFERTRPQGGDACLVQQ